MGKGAIRSGAIENRIAGKIGKHPSHLFPDHLLKFIFRLGKGPVVSLEHYPGNPEFHPCEIPLI